MAEGSLAQPLPGLAGSRPAIFASSVVNPISHSLPSYFQMPIAAVESNCFQMTFPPRVRYPASIASERIVREPFTRWNSRLKSNGVLRVARHSRAIMLPCSSFWQLKTPLRAIHDPNSLTASSEVPMRE
ncbi:MAG: hypothetical protein ACK55Z_32120 [bacterium]